MTDSSRSPFCGSSGSADSTGEATESSDLPFISPAKMVDFLTVTLEMERELQSIEYAASGMFDLSHPQTLKQLELRQSVLTVYSKIEAARSMLRWLAANRVEGGGQKGG